MLINTGDFTTKKSTFQRRIIVPIVLCVLVVLLAFFQYWALLKESLHETTSVFLGELNSQRAHRISSAAGNSFLFLDSMASSISKYENLGSPEVQNILAEHLNYDSLFSFSVMTPDGNSYNKDGSVTQVGDDDTFQAGMRGEKVVRSILVPDLRGSTHALGFFTPIYRDNTVVGVLNLTFRPGMLHEMIRSQVFAGKGNTYILDSDGAILFQQGEKRFWVAEHFFTTVLKDASFATGHSHETFMQDMREGKEGHFVYQQGTERQHVDYQRLGLNDWYLLSSVPGKVIDDQPYFVIQMTFLLCGVVAMTLLLLIWYLFYITRKGVQAAERAQRELALLASNIPGGVYCCFNDANFTEISHSKGFLELTGYAEEELKTFFDGKFLNMIYEEDRRQVLNSIDEQLKYGSRIELCYRLRRRNGKLLWILEKGQLVISEQCTSLFYCVMVDISAQIEARQELEESKRELENLTANIPGGVTRCRYDDDFTLEYASEGFLELLGYTREELMGMKGTRLERTIHPQDLNRLLQDLQARFACDKMFETEYRLVKKNGEAIWVFYKAKLTTNKNETCVIDSVFIDITERKTTLDNLFISEERYRLLAELTDTIIYEYDMKNDSVYISSKWKEKFGYDLKTDDVILNLQHTDIVHEEDKAALFGMLENLMTGTRSDACEYRIRHSSGGFVWCRNIATVVMDQDGTPVKILGKISDIDKTKKEQEALTEKAQRDALTGLYNKGATKMLIDAYLQGEGKDSISALMVVDVDNFKSVNDNLGHMFGDAVLSCISSDIQRLFRATDVIGRIGGDEFIVFLKKMPLESFVVKGANSICEALQTTFAGESKEYCISASVGVAMYPKDGTTFNDLFKNADSALYKSKEKGKNQFSFYNMETDFCLLACDLRPLPQQQNVAPLRTRSEYTANLPARILEALCEARDLYTAITFTLQFVGKQYNVSRVYVFERVDNALFNNTCEWCAEGILPQKDLLQMMDLEKEFKYSSLFNEDGVFYCPDISRLNKNLYGTLAPQGIRSMLQCSFHEDAVFKGFIGFDECSDNRLWTKIEVESLALIAKILGLFIVKMRTYERLKKTLSMFQSAINNQTLWVYVVDPSTHKILFLNQKTRDSVGAVEGSLCHDTLRGNDAPCADCPMHDLSDTVHSKSCEVYNHRVQRWIEATASYVDWQSPDRAVLMCCFDITKYKKRICAEETCVTLPEQTDVRE